MGFTPKRTIIKLKFEDADLEGLEVRAYSVPLGQFLNMTEMADLDEADLMKNVRVMGDLLAGFGAALVSWNVQHEDGTPVPSDLDGLRGQEFPFVLRIVRAWLDAMGSVAGPLAPGSPAGAPSVAPQMPMEPLSASRAS